jgi:hypothetical protein
VEPKVGIAVYLFDRLHTGFRENSLPAVQRIGASCAVALGVSFLFRELAKGYRKGRRSNCKGRRSVLDPSKGIYLGGTLLSILLSLYLFTSGRRETGIFVGLWAPTVLNLGQTLMEDDKD